MDAEDYELVSHQALDKMRKEIEEIKRNPFGDKEEGKSLLVAVDRLNENIGKLMDVFHAAEKQIVDEYFNNKPSILLRQISDQNKKLAQGMVALANLIKKQEKVFFRELEDLGEKQEADFESVEKDTREAVQDMEEYTKEELASELDDFAKKFTPKAKKALKAKQKADEEEAEKQPPATQQIAQEAAPPDMGNPFLNPQPSDSSLNPSFLSNPPQAQPTPQQAAPQQAFNPANAPMPSNAGLPPDVTNILEEQPPETSDQVPPLGGDPGPLPNIPPPPTKKGQSVFQK